MLSLVEFQQSCIVGVDAYPPRVFLLIFPFLFFCSGQAAEFCRATFLIEGSGKERHRNSQKNKSKHEKGWEGMMIVSDDFQEAIRIYICVVCDAHLQ